MNELSATPLYLQLQNLLRNKIEAGEWRMGTKIPSEGELSAEYKVSRITVRSALRTLVEEGFLETKQGKGTFIINGPQKITISYSAPAFSEFCLLNGQAPKRIQLIKRLEKANDLDIALLGAQPGENIFYLSRILIAGETTVGLVENRLREFCTFLMDEDTEATNLIKIVQKKIDKIIISVNRSFEIIPANKEVAAHLAISVASPLLVIRDIWTDKKNNTIGLVKEQFIGDKVKVSYHHSLLK
jgi:GntR family transcriptional regulator